MREENNSMLYDFIEDNQFELDSYLTYLFDQINNGSEILLED
ncbi:hypothetical protein [Priestia megaterium]|jgi:hypothetical protein|nr:hypothetical protein [Priestia megaterium]MDH3168844.1 hypothetical protein [Priestia megaterium]MED4240920.1 hypothetical protein [Priestia megaterium]MED4268077.1 hypothetical protein [Priestia megaterium]MED4274133.1 hypothetical protein [Priestia megaterium]MED4287315.1 hypothetical protein [Priestia megaterium]